jgi:hypothetical protein
MQTLIFAIVMLHLVAGFGWIIYKLEFQTKKSEKTNHI